MIRARFLSDSNDPRPVNWPIKHPYWVTGYSADFENTIIVAYAEDEGEILKNWPEAKEIEAEESSEYVFSARFPKPEWFKD